MVDLEAFYKVLHPDTISGSTPFFTPEDVVAMTIAESSSPCEIKLLSALVEKPAVTLDHALYLGTCGGNLINKGVVIKGSDGTLVRVNHLMSVIKKVLNLTNNPESLEQLGNASFSKVLQYLKELGLLKGIFTPNGKNRRLVPLSHVDDTDVTLSIPMANFWEAYFDALCGEDSKFRETLTDGFNMNVSLHDVSMALNVAIKFDVFDVDDFAHRLFDTFKNSNPSVIIYI